MINGKFDTNIMFRTIKKNNEAYLNDKTTTSFKKAFYKSLDDDVTLNICKVIADTLNDFLKYDYVDENELRKVVADLKMFTSPSSSNAYVNEDNVFMISQNMIKIASIIYQDNNVEKDTIIHECMHLIQKTSGDSNKNYMRVGVSKKWNDLVVNPLEWKFLILILFVNTLLHKLRIFLMAK